MPKKRISTMLDENIAKELYKKIIDEHGQVKGHLTDAYEEAVSLWLEKKKQETQEETESKTTS